MEPKGIIGSYAKVHVVQYWTGEKNICISVKMGMLQNIMRPKNKYKIKYNHSQLFGNAFIHFSLTTNILEAFQHAIAVDLGPTIDI